MSANGWGTRPRDNRVNRMTSGLSRAVEIVPATTRRPRLRPTSRATRYRGRAAIDTLFPRAENVRPAWLVQIVGVEPRRARGDAYRGDAGYLAAAERADAMFAIGSSAAFQMSAIGVSLAASPGASRRRASQIVRSSV